MIVVVIALTVIWIVINWSCGGILSSNYKNAQIELQDRQLVDYRAIDALESTIRLTIGSKWKPLTKEESDPLRTAVASLPKRRILAQG